MRISKAIRKLQQIQAKHGDLDINRGPMTHYGPLQGIMVLDAAGKNVWPRGESEDEPKGVYLK